MNNKGLFFMGILEFSNGDKLQKSIENCKNHLIDKKHIFTIVKDKLLFDYYCIKEYKFNFVNFKNFFEYENFKKNNQKYFDDYKRFLKYKKQNMNWYFFKWDYFEF